MKKNEPLLMFTGSRNPDFFYATRFEVGDPVAFLVARGKKFLLLNDLEIDRGRKDAEVDRVVSS